MIGFLRGKVLDQEEGRVTLGVGSADDSAVGYTVTVGQDPFTVGASVELHIHTHVREDALDLYGFRTRAEKQLFLALLSVSGIGPKGAMAVLAGGTLEALLDAIENGDVAYLCRAPGVGKKTGERIVLELADSIRKKRALGIYGNTASTASRPSGATSALGGVANRRTVVFREAMTALVGLGYRSVEVEELLTRIFEESGAEPPARVEDLLKTALRQLA